MISCKGSGMKRLANGNKISQHLLGEIKEIHAELLSGQFYLGQHSNTSTFECEGHSGLLNDVCRCLDQGGSTYFFPRAKDRFPVGPKGQKNPTGAVIENQ
jgi:hypothetical protein